MTKQTPTVSVDWQIELNATAFKYHLLIARVGLMLNLVFAIGDYFNSPVHFVDFLIFRIVVSSIMLFVVLFKNKFIHHPEIIVLIPVLAISTENAFMYSVLDGAEFQKHTISYIALFIAAGMFILWKPIYSIIVVVVSLVVNIIFFGINSHLSANEILINGGLLTLTIALLSILQIHLRTNLTKKEISLRLTLAEFNNQLTLQKEIINKKNKDITDSIDYAKTIQDATLPIIELKQKFFPDSFILFKPKDIVSGDFYWFAEKNEKKIIAACDCTGHGVPGALMSMIGMNLLNQIVNERGITSPNEILNCLHIETRKALKQEDSGKTKDGMDIAVVTFNSEKEIEFAGARRPLWIISKTVEQSKSILYPIVEEQKNTGTGLGSVICEIKGDKFSIGGAQNEFERKFTCHQVSLNKGDCIYIFSDGYADQFSNLHEKLMTSRFKDLVINMQKKSMPNQKIFLNNFIKRWRGKRQQIDDILVIGIRI